MSVRSSQRPHAASAAFGEGFRFVERFKLDEPFPFDEPFPLDEPFRFDGAGSDDDVDMKEPSGIAGNQTGGEGDDALERINACASKCLASAL